MDKSYNEEFLVAADYFEERNRDDVASSLRALATWGSGSPNVLIEIVEPVQHNTFWSAVVESMLLPKLSHKCAIRLSPSFGGVQLTMSIWIRDNKYGIQQTFDARHEERVPVHIAREFESQIMSKLYELNS